MTRGPAHFFTERNAKLSFPFSRASRFAGFIFIDALEKNCSTKYQEHGNQTRKKSRRSLRKSPNKLLMPSSFTNITEISLKTIPSASKIEIKRVLDSLYGFEVHKVRNLNMEGKKKKRGGILIAKPDYKKAYVTLVNPLSISPDMYPIRIIEEDKRSLNKQSRSSIVEEGEVTRHWLYEKEPVGFKAYKGFANRDRPRIGRAEAAEPSTKFPWSSMRSGG